MTATLATATRNAMVDAAVDLIDAGSGPGVVVIATAGMSTTLATVTLPDPAMPAASSGSSQQTVITNVTAVATGTAAAFEVRDSDANVIWSGDVTATSGGGGVELSKVALAVDDDVDITSMTFAVNASA